MHTSSFFCHLDQFLNLLIVEHPGFGLADDHHLDVFVARLNHVQQSLDHQLESLLVALAFLVVLLQKLAHLLGIPPATLSPPLRKRSRRVSVVKMWLGIVKSCNKTTDSVRPHSALLCKFLLGLSDVFGNVFHGRTVVVVQPVTLALDSCLVGQDSSVGCESRICHMDVVVQLHYFLDCFALLQLGYCFFLGRAIGT